MAILPAPRSSTVEAQHAAVALGSGGSRARRQAARAYTLDAPRRERVAFER